MEFTTTTTQAASRRGSEVAVAKTTQQTFKCYNNVDGFVRPVQQQQPKMLTYQQGRKDPQPAAGMVRPSTERPRKTSTSAYEGAWRRSLRQSDNQGQQQQQQQERFLDIRIQCHGIFLSFFLPSKSLLIYLLPRKEVAMDGWL